MCYVHLGKKGDDHANQIMIVNGKSRVKISTKTTPGTNWTDDWHHARIVRNCQTGSFDDTGNFDNVLPYGKKVKTPKK